MWQFLRRHTEQSNMSTPDKGARPRPLRFAQLIDDIGDFGDLKTHDEALKFWLPEPAAEALRELCQRNGDSMSEILRQFFAQHCYGVYAFQAMIERDPGLFRDAETGYFSRPSRGASLGQKRNPTYWVPELGKNVAPIKVWIPHRVKGDLQTLAEHVGIKLSQYVREIVISRLLGHGTLPKRPEMVNAEPLPAADDWCDGIPTPMREVPEEDYRLSFAGEERLGGDPTDSG